MSEELLNTLEEKVQNAVEMIELLKSELEDAGPLRAQIAELTEENNSLKEARSQWEEKLTSLIGKFEQLEETSGNDADDDHDDIESDDDGDSDAGSGEHSYSS
ncbi:MAG: cell division protein ZapB [SAR324 cluster bacterium]|nr:cell division protein ZapB [SAR324 cluster bacterium]